MLTFNISCFTLLLNKMQEENLKMSKFVIKSSILERLEKMKNIRVENRYGKKFIIACNDTVACVYYLGETQEKDEVLYLKISKKLITGDDVSIETVPEFAMACVFVGTKGRYEDCISWHDSNFMDDWIKWFTEPVDKSNGVMFWDLYQVSCLFETSPTGDIVFPDVIDSSKPIIVRDVNSNDWVGAFIPSLDSDKPLKPAKLPEWLNADKA